ncbi:MAG: SpoIIE family protein phosphatase [bacterium]|nr:SpoIIE family protein phosphatase [bacterium]
MDLVQLLYFSLFIIILMVLIFGFHYLRMKTYRTPYIVLFSFLWLLSMITGHLGYKIQLDLWGYLTLNIRYSSSIYVLIFSCILLVYVCEGVRAGRDIIIASIGIQAIMVICQYFLGSITLPLLSDEKLQAAVLVFEPSFRRQVVSISSTIVDLFFAVTFFQFLVNRLKKVPTGLHIYLALLATLYLDSLLFVAGTRFDTFLPTLTSHLIYKTVIVSAIAVPFALYVNRFKQRGGLDLDRGSLDIFMKLEKMEEELSIAYQRLQEYAATLEEKVQERTEDLQCANRKLERSNKELTEAQRVAEQDLCMAISVQSRLMPKENPDQSNWDIAFEFKPMAGVSGDLYDFYEIDGTLHGVGLFDVSGHGIASGLITVIAKPIIYRAFKRMKNNRLDEVITKINLKLQQAMGNTDNFLTGVLLRFNEDTIEYVNAAHPDIIIKRSNGSVDKIIRDDLEWKGSVLGIEEMTSEFKTLKFNTGKGDIVLIYSDGLPESRNPEGVDYTEARIVESITSAPDGTAQETLNFVMNNFYDFVKTKKLGDDLSVLLLKKNR